MDEPKRTPGGQAINDTYEPQQQDMNPTFAPTGPTLGMQFVDGKSGSVESVGLPQTDHTDLRSGPAPEY